MVENQTEQKLLEDTIVSSEKIVVGFSGMKTGAGPNFLHFYIGKPQPDVRCINVILFGDRVCFACCVFPGT